MSQIRRFFCSLTCICLDDESESLSSSEYSAQLGEIDPLWPKNLKSLKVYSNEGSLHWNIDNGKLERNVITEFSVINKQLSHSPSHPSSLLSSSHSKLSKKNLCFSDSFQKTNNPGPLLHSGKEDKKSIHLRRNEELDTLKNSTYFQNILSPIDIFLPIHSNSLQNVNIKSHIPEVLNRLFPHIREIFLNTISLHFLKLIQVKDALGKEMDLYKLSSILNQNANYSYNALLDIEGELENFLIRRETFLSQKDNKENIEKKLNMILNLIDLERIILDELKKVKDFMSFFITDREKSFPYLSSVSKFFKEIDFFYRKECELFNDRKIFFNKIKYFFKSLFFSFFKEERAEERIDKFSLISIWESDSPQILYDIKILEEKTNELFKYLDALEKPFKTQSIENIEEDMIFYFET